MVATDGHRLSKAEHKLSEGEGMLNFKMLVPSKGISELKRMIEAALPGAEVEVVDEGGGDHLRAIVTAEQFSGKSRIDQHRMVKAAVKPRFEDGTIHALSVSTSVPD